MHWVLADYRQWKISEKHSPTRRSTGLHETILSNELQYLFSANEGEMLAELVLSKCIEEELKVSKINDHRPEGSRS